MSSASNQSASTNKPAIVLVSPKGPDNVGSVARAMKNFGLHDLRIVQPRCDISKGHVMASHAQDVLEQASVFETLLEAIAGCELVVGTTARDRRDHAPPISPRQAAGLYGSGLQAAILFGREEHGLFNDELDLCQVHVRIPTDEYASLNLAQAVQVLVYEMFLQRQTPVQNLPTKPISKPAERVMLDHMYHHLGDFMLEVGYTDPQRKDHMLRRFRQMLDRANLTEYDVGLLRGLLAQGIWSSRKARGDGVPNTTSWPRGQVLDAALQGQAIDPNFQDQDQANLPEQAPEVTKESPNLAKP